MKEGGVKDIDTRGDKVPHLQRLYSSLLLYYFCTNMMRNMHQHGLSERQHLFTLFSFFDSFFSLLLTLDSYCMFHQETRREKGMRTN